MSLLSVIESERWRIVCQWIPTHEGVEGNERADQLAKQGAQLPQPIISVSLTSAKSKIETVTKRHLNDVLHEVAAGKQWKCLTQSRLLCRDMPRLEGSGR